VTPQRPAEPRLLALRLQGFKSFAERTSVEFGRGISAVVGPNGSGKSNLADALRWALGEQGRALRSRKAEDVIWAGSEKRSAQGMADVTLVLDNGDGLLPVEYQVLELGRRLYRSGENDYLLNKNRIRLRDLVDLLDAANLADNAFLFIGQGMVDQALALRPEERRPLFEEVAGVRRHERRRRRAEEQLAESESNLARVEDILAELRPQARRLAAQAEQQANRATTAEELLDALTLTLHERWFETAARLTASTAERDAARARSDAAMADLTSSENAATELSIALAQRAAIERDRRAAHETARSALTALELRSARSESELAALNRDRRRVADERAAAEAAVAEARRTQAVQVPTRDIDLDARLAEAERELADALAELGALRSAQQAQGEQLAALRRAAATRQAEIETARRRLADVERRAADETDRATLAFQRRETLVAAHEIARVALGAAVEAEASSASHRLAVRDRAASAEAARVAAHERAVAAGAGAAAGRARLEELQARLSEEESRGIARAARRLGGRRVDEDLDVDPPLRAAIEAALAERSRAYVVASGSVGSLARERGGVVVEERVTAAAPADDAKERQFREALTNASGGTLDTAVRRDGAGVARRLLARAAWLPDLEACLGVQALVPRGWIVVPRDGSAIVTDLGVTFGAAERVLEQRSEATRLAREVEAIEQEAADLRAASVRAAAEAQRHEEADATARIDEHRAAGERRTAEEAERVAARELEAAVREAAWHEAQAARLADELERARSAMHAVADDGPAATTSAQPPDPEAGGGAGRDAIGAWEARAAGLRKRRDRLSAEVATLDAVRREAEAVRARAEAASAIAGERLAAADREIAALADREHELAAERDGLRREAADAAAREVAARGALDEVVAADVADRERLATAERAAAAARDRLRAVDAQLRTADHAELEARLGFDALHESVVVELSGLGDLALRRLAAIVGGAAASAADLEPAELGEGVEPATRSDHLLPVAVPDDVAALEAALANVAPIWSAAPPTDAPPSAARLGQLRRRFHELGAVNPYAVDEYAELKTRLETLEAQASDLRTAIAKTRDLIAELDTMIADRFRSTFAALEMAFAARFEQLFGGGFARLSLTDPGDLGATGIEIVARPPGKKAQALAMLSGGERALTAVALLFAMLEVRPVPFCVLDEVDAALDEANIGRFADALRSLADGTQFIVITHNRGTIEAADALYGVTVGDDSVSRVISLRLDEAQAIAARDRGVPVATG
jgi:chromosome segregation protein